MSKFIRLINQGIQDLFISDGENLGDYSCQFKRNLSIWLTAISAGSGRCPL